jgi:hypothetical protein
VGLSNKVSSAQLSKVLLFTGATDQLLRGGWEVERKEGEERER